MDIQEAKEKIRKSEAAIISLQNKAIDEGPGFNREEEALIAQFEGAIESLKLELPERPLTMHWTVGKQKFWRRGLCSSWTA